MIYTNLYYSMPLSTKNDAINFEIIYFLNWKPIWKFPSISLQ